MFVCWRGVSHPRHPVLILIPVRAAASSSDTTSHRRKGELDHSAVAPLIFKLILWIQSIQHINLFYKKPQRKLRDDILKKTSRSFVKRLILTMVFLFIKVLSLMFCSWWWWQCWCCHSWSWLQWVSHPYYHPLVTPAWCRTETVTQGRGDLSI